MLLSVEVKLLIVGVLGCFEFDGCGKCLALTRSENRTFWKRDRVAEVAA